MKKKFAVGFTLIELLIVVAIIAILAAIAVPNFLEAQTRAKVSRVKSDQRTMATALESYYIDYNSYPLCNSFGVVINSTAPGIGGSENWRVLESLSTPVAYITNSVIPDPFKSRKRTGSVYTGSGAQPGMGGTYPSVNNSNIAYQTYQYQSVMDSDRGTLANVVSLKDKPKAWTFFSAGPDGIYLNAGGVLANNSSHQDSRTPADKLGYCSNLVYDPTNGTISFGEIFRNGGNINGRYAYFYFQACNSAK